MLSSVLFFLLFLLILENYTSKNNFFFSLYVVLLSSPSISHQSVETSPPKANNCTMHVAVLLSFVLVLSVRSGQHRIPSVTAGDRPKDAE